MSAIVLIERRIHDTYAIISEYKTILLLSDRPEEKLRAIHKIEEFEIRIKKDLQEYIELSGQLLGPIPSDIQEIISMYHVFSKANIQVDQNLRQQNKVVKIVFLAANPLDTAQLRLDQEFRSIREVLSKVKFRDRIDTEIFGAVRIKDLQGYILESNPNILHFSGHGNSKSEIILEDDSGLSQSLSIQALSNLFSVLKEKVQCVVLNACYSEQQALAIAEHIDSVIGISGTILDPAAISFSTSFYQAIGYGKDVKTAFDAGCNQIDLENLAQGDRPKLIATKCNPKEIRFIVE